MTNDVRLIKVVVQWYFRNTLARLIYYSHILETNIFETLRKTQKYN